MTGQPRRKRHADIDAERLDRRSKLSVDKLVGVVVLILGRIAPDLRLRSVGVGAIEGGRHPFIGHQEEDRNRTGKTDVSRHEKGGTKDSGRNDHRRLREIPPLRVLERSTQANSIMTC